MTEHTQARTSDLPGWSCPPRVRDIPSTPESWGWITVVPGCRFLLTGAPGRTGQCERH